MNKFNMMKVYLVIFAVILSLTGFSVGLEAEEYYTWTDENGNIHMGNAPAEAPKAGAKVKNYSYEESSPAQRAAERRAQDYKNRYERVNRDYQRESERTSERAAQREKDYNKSQCDYARLSEKRYRYNWRNARTDRETMYWKEKLDEIELICR